MTFNLKDFIKNKKLLQKWIFSYAIILLITILICFFVFNITSNAIKTSDQNSYDLALNRIYEKIENEFSNIEKTSAVMRSSSANRLILDKNISDTAEAIRDVQQDIRTQRLNSDYILDLMAVFQDKNIAVSHSSQYSIDDAFKLWFSDCFPSAADFESYLFSGRHAQFDKIADKTGGDKIINLQRFPIENFKEVNGALIVTINEYAINSLLRSMLQKESGEIIILDKFGQQIYGTSKLFADVNFLANSNRFEHNINGEKHIINTKVNNDRRYVLIVSGKVYDARVEGLMRAVIIICLLAILLGALISAYFIKINYTPLEKIVRSMNGDNEEISYEYIDKIYGEVLKEQDLMKKQLEKQEIFFYENSLIAMLNSKEEIDNNVQFSYKSFVVLVFDIDDFGVLIEGGRESQAYSLSKLTISNVLSELMAEKADCKYCETEGKYVCIINFSKIEENFIYKNVKYMVGFLEKELQMYFICGISSKGVGAASLSELYDQAKQALHYRFINNEKKIFLYENNLRDNINVYSYDIETERQIYQCITVGEYEKAQSLITKITQYNFNERLLDSKMAKMLMLEIVSTLTKAISDVNVQSNLILELSELLDEIYSYSTFEQIKSRIDEITDAICKIVAKNKRKNNIISASRMEKCVEYIKYNFSDPSMSAQNIAAFFNITVSYLSKSFKEYTGENVGNYIAHLRIEKAKELLKDNTLKIYEVAISVGFYDSGSFIRVFKNCEGITPGQYRENI